MRARGQESRATAKVNWQHGRERPSLVADKGRRSKTRHEGMAQTALILGRGIFAKKFETIARSGRVSKVVYESLGVWPRQHSIL